MRKTDALSFRADEETRLRARLLAAARGTTVTELVLEALGRLLDEAEDMPIVPNRRRAEK